jgi:hypothetical protein
VDLDPLALGNVLKGLSQDVGGGSPSPRMQGMQEQGWWRVCVSHTIWPLLGLLLFFAVLGWLAQECVPGASHLLQVIQGGECGWLLHIAWTRPVFSCTEQWAMIAVGRDSCPGGVTYRELVVLHLKQGRWMAGRPLGHTTTDEEERMDVAARRNRTLFRWIMVTLLAALLPFAALAQPATGQADGAEAATAAEEAQCRACTYERIGTKVDIGLVALVSLLVVGLLTAASREWGTTSQRWTCRTLALLLVGVGLALLWWAGSVVYLGYNPWQEMAAPADGSLTSTLLSTSPKWLAALVLIGLAPSIWKRSERLPAWRIG